MSNPQHEPTMEEILASIRKIISEDSDAPAAEAAPAPSAPPPPPPPAAVADDVFDLTHVVEEPAPAPDVPENDLVFQSVEQTAPQPATYSAPVHAMDNDIFSDSTRKALDDTFATLDANHSAAPASAPIPPVHAAAGPVGGSVEAVFERAVRDSFDPVLKKWLDDNSDALIQGMKPLIREWMDSHFPALLEGAVRNEVARVVKARQR